jgi:hypothetical protein
VDALFEKRVPRGFPYFDLLDRIHQHVLPRTYVEIGVSTGRSLTLALPGTMSVGIDPDPRLSFPLRRGARIFHQTSDEFFACHDLTRLFGGLQLDLAFIDGMHHFEVALRDFMNLEKSSSIGTTILVHDCLPIDEVTAARERSTSVWSGDVWRLIALLREFRPDLEVNVVDVGPTGLGIIRGLDPKSTVLSDQYDEIVERYLAVPYKKPYGSDLIEPKGSDWETVKALLPEAPFRHANVEMLKIQRSWCGVAPIVMRGVNSARFRLATRADEESDGDEFNPNSANS